MSELEKAVQWAEGCAKETNSGQKLNGLIRRAGNRQIVSQIFEEMCSDEQDDGDNLIRYYSLATVGERNIINAVLIALCGYSFPSIVERSRKNEN